MNGIDVRIMQLIKELKTNKNGFCRALGYNNNAMIENYTGKRKSKPGFEFLNALLRTYPQVNATWLITGEGEMIVNPRKANALIAERNELGTHAPLVSHFAYAGYLRGFGDTEFLESQPVYFSTHKYSHGNYMAFEIRGDSMRDGSELSICEGDIVLCRELDSDYWKQVMKTPKVYILIHKTEGITCKEITRHDVETGEITCHSWNSDPEYADFTINLRDVIQMFSLKEISRKTRY